MDAGGTLFAASTSVTVLCGIQLLSSCGCRLHACTTCAQCALSQPEASSSLQGSLCRMAVLQRCSLRCRARGTVPLLRAASNQP